MMGTINWGRLILGGLAAGIVLFAMGFVIHAVILEDHYKWFQEQGSVMKFPKQWGFPLHIAGTLVSGVAIALLYVFSRKHFGPGPKAAVMVGLVVGAVSLSGISAEYAFYNLGKMIPAMTFVDNVLGAILAALVAGMLYKD
jgi:hypothetical protein